MTEQHRTWRPAWPCPAGAIWSAWRRGAGDPTYRIVGGGHWRGLGTPDGPATVRVAADPSAGVIDADAWGPGADWALERLPAMLGAEDDPSMMPLLHPPLRRAAHEHRHWRVGRGGFVLDALTPAAIEQKVTGQEAFAGFRRLVRRYGQPAPGPGVDVDLWVQPDAATLRSIPSWAWLNLGIDGARSSVIVAAASVADQLQRTIDLPAAEADRRLRSIPGVGQWTSAEVRQRAHGDPDAISFGDYHVARHVGWALTGQPLDDDGLADLVEPYRGHRYRVQRLVELAGLGLPRHGPRQAPRTHLPGGSPRR